MNAAAFLVSCLENERVRFAFGIPGEENLELMDSLRDSSIRFVLTRHEEAAAFMADVLGRLTTHAGVCLATLGPGATNLVTGVADAFLDRAPLVAITAQTNLSRVHRESHQFVDILQLFDPITKWNARIESPDTIPEIVRKAFKLAEAEKPGSTHVELPENIADEEANAASRPLPIERIGNPSPDRASLDTAADLIQKAERPIVLAGNGVIRSGASDELRGFAEDLHIPVAHTFMGKGAMPWTSPMNLLTVGVLPRDYELAGLDESDLVIAIGFDFVEYDPRSWNPRGDRRIVHIDSLPAEISVHYVPEVEVVGEIRTSLHVLREQVRRPREPAWAIRSRERVLKRLESELGERSKGVLKPQRILWELRDILGPDDLLISDVGAHKLWLGRFFRTMKPNTVIISNGLSAMGIPPGGNCREARRSGSPGHDPERRRRIPDEHPRTGDSKAGADRHGELGLSRRWAREHSMEADGQVRADDRYRVRQSRLRTPRGGVRDSRFSRGTSVRIEFGSLRGAAGSLTNRGRRPGRLQR